MVDAPSIVHYTVKPMQGSKGSDLLWNSLSAGWAIFIMCAMLSVFAGITVWLLVCTHFDYFNFLFQF